MRAVQMAIYEERAARSMRGKGPALNKEDFKPGVKVDGGGCDERLARGHDEGLTKSTRLDIATRTP